MPTMQRLRTAALLLGLLAAVVGGIRFHGPDAPSASARCGAQGAFAGTLRGRSDALVTPPDRLLTQLGVPPEAPADKPTRAATQASLGPSLGARAGRRSRAFASSRIAAHIPWRGRLLGAIPPGADWLVAASTLSLYCRLITTGQFARAGALCARAPLWSRRLLGQPSSFDFRSAQVVAAPDERTVVLAAKVLVHARRAAALPDGLAVLVFTLRKAGKQGEWLVASVSTRPYTSRKGSA